MLANWWLPISRQEDDWDALISVQLNKREDNVRWIDAVREAEQENQVAYDRDVAKDKEITRKMQKIVDLETDLALKEGQTIVRGRRRKPIRIIKP